MKRVLKLYFLLLLVMGNSQGASVVSADVDAIQSAGAEHVDLDVFCQTNACRKDVHFLLKTDNGLIDQHAAHYWPVVQGDKLSLLAGEKTMIEGRLDGKKFTKFTVATNSIKAISFDLKQNEEDVGMLLVINNPHVFRIKVSIDWVDLQGNLHKTSSCPVMAGGSGYETWPHPILEMEISHIRKMTSSEAMNCAY